MDGEVRSAALREATDRELLAEVVDRIGGAGATRAGALRMRRKLAGLTLVEAARRTGITAAHLSMAERGKHGISRQVRRKLARAYGCKIADLTAAEPALATDEGSGTAA